jgi:CubicO group peptidase (beta-lactamase class C family)
MIAPPFASFQPRGATRPLLWALAFAFVVAGCGGAAEVVRPLTGRSDVDAIFAEFDRPGSPGCALGVIQGGEFVYRRGFGDASVEHGVPIDTDSVLKVASVSKQFTAMVVLILAERGDLSLDDPLGDWVPEMAALGPITLRHLLHHTSGLRDYLTLSRLAGYRDEDYFTTADVLDLLARQRELNFAPGAEYRYSNTGYVLLAVIAERAAGKPFADLAAELIFEPLGMSSTRFDVDPNAIVERRAQGYAPRDDGFAISATTLPVVGDGGLLTSVNDLLAWDRNFYDNQLGAGTPDLIRQWITPGRLGSGGPVTTPDGGTYGAGIVVGEYRGVGRVTHSGSYVGFRASMARFPEVRTTVITLCNVASAAAPELTLRVADIFLASAFGPEEPARETASTAAPDDEFTVPLSQLREYQGRYVSRELGVTYVVRLRDGRLVVSLPDRWESPLAARQDDTFLADEVGVEVHFHRNSAGGVDGFRLDAGWVTGLGFERIG